MSATKVDVTIRGSGREIFDTTEAPSAASELQRTANVGSATSLSVSLNGNTTPKVDKPPVSLKITLGGSPTTINLTAIAGLALPPSATRTLDMTGAKVVGVFLDAPATNVAAVNVAPGASTPYPLFGTGNDVEIDRGETLGKAFGGIASNKPAVSPTVKNIDVSGTAGDVLYIDLYLGT
jgi:hypothetical protein